MIHPAVQNFTNYITNDSKPFDKVNLLKLCSSMAKEDKEFFTGKIKENVSREELVDILKTMSQAGPKPAGTPQVTPKKNIPTVYKKGDVLMHPIFNHPYILLEKKEEHWLCCLVTSEETCPEILEACKSRFFADNFITRVLFTTVDPIGRFMYPYENPRQLNSVLKKLKELFV
jgi:hypothetical protein